MGETLRDLRRAANLTQLQVAQALGLDHRGYMRRETGRAKLTAEESLKLAELFGVPVERVIRARRVAEDGRRDYWRRKVTA
ncbi:helix-turn-helix transcriptional regulator [Caldinitratiruptor microaerophilus]|uniref:HTH cro/C1-type domain-containing protein n=1 Tax=Caldinitratiruptor microaerophilus TaxID=671077 RepID=A0AA35G7T7_9FIRM|nr:helix-turn-helix transcriptional regulator [Caldinitratiruptor microaerophilus]BDG60260.1 hypothetical protein caldi_13500 [Caldinitratiruptor microaerophilus]